MEKINLLSNKDILEKKFEATSKGYNPLEVDKFLDDIMQTLSIKNKQIESTSKELIFLKEENEKLKKDFNEIEKSFTLFKKRYKNLNDDDFSKYSMIDLIKRVNVYETKLNELGIDPEKYFKSQSE